MAERPILTGDERRVQGRRPLHTRVTVLSGGRQPVQGRSFDVSATGIGLVLDVNLGADTACALMFRMTFPNGSAFEARTNATVAYSLLSAELRGFKTGVHFVSPPLDLVQALARYLGAARPAVFGGG